MIVMYVLRHPKVSKRFCCLYIGEENERMKEEPTRKQSLKQYLFLRHGEGICDINSQSF